MSCFGFCIIKGIIDIVASDSYFMLIFSLFIILIILLIGLLNWANAVDRGYYKTFNKVKLESSKFNNRFNVYSSDQIEARYALSPSLMERLYNLKTAYSARNIRCSFYEDKLIIAVETKKDLFEFGNLFKSVKDSNNIYQFYKELTSIFNIIDSLKLRND